MVDEMADVVDIVRLGFVPWGHGFSPVCKCHDAAGSVQRQGWGDAMTARSA